MVRLTRTITAVLAISMLTLTVFVGYITNNFHKQLRRFSFLIDRTDESGGKLQNKHLILEDADIGDREIFIIGDVHGCLDELDELLSLAQTEIKDKTLLPIFVGDLSNKGPKNAETIRRMRKMGAYAVRGNHDEGVIKQLLKYRQDIEYELPEKYQWTKELDDDDLGYLQGLPYIIRIPSKNVIVVHAGIVPEMSLADHDTSIFITMRNLYEENGILKPNKNYDKGEAWASLWQGPEHVYFGHDARRKLQQYPYATGLDTGCVYGFSLSGVLLSQKKILQVKAKDIYEQPKEKG